MIAADDMMIATRRKKHKKKLSSLLSLHLLKTQRPENMKAVLISCDQFRYQTFGFFAPVLPHSIFVDFFISTTF
jgi:predicted N-acetyltransferase YhbS